MSGDWSSDVCSSDLSAAGRPGQIPAVSGVLDSPSPHRPTRSTQGEFPIRFGSFPPPFLPLAVVYVTVAAGQRRPPRSPRPGLGTGLNRPAGRLSPMEARPSIRTGPARRPVPSGWTPACAPGWAGFEAGSLCHWPGLHPGLGRPVGRPATVISANWENKLEV